MREAIDIKLRWYPAKRRWGIIFLYDDGDHHREMPKLVRASERDIDDNGAFEMVMIVTGRLDQRDVMTSYRPITLQAMIQAVMKRRETRCVTHGQVGGLD